jgi:hypothetical protein
MGKNHRKGRNRQNSLKRTKEEEIVWKKGSLRTKGL